MHRGEKQNVGAHFAVPGILIFDLAVSDQENQKIDEHESNGDYRPAAASMFSCRRGMSIAELLRLEG